MERPEITIPFNDTELHISVTDGEHMYVECKEVTLRGVSYRFDFHLYRKADGTGVETRGDMSAQYNAFYITRRDDQFKPVSSFARQTFRQLTINRVAEWVKGNPEASWAFKQGDQYDLEEQLASLEYKIAEKNDELNALNTQYRDVEAKLRNATGTSVTV